VIQWSGHILNQDGTLDHLEYLCEEDKDPREEFSSTLLKALGNKGSKSSDAFPVIDVKQNRH